MSDNGDAPEHQTSNGEAVATASLLLACVVDDVCFGARDAAYPTLLRARFEVEARPAQEVVVRVATLALFHAARPARLEVAALGADGDLLAHAASTLPAGSAGSQQVNVTDLAVVFDAPGSYRLGVALDGRAAYFPLDVRMAQPQAEAAR